MGKHTIQCFGHATYQTCGLCGHIPVESRALTIQAWDFYGGNMPKESSDCIYIPVTLFDSVFRMDKNYSTQVFLVEYKSIVKSIKENVFIIDDLYR